MAHAGTCCAVKYEHCIVGLISLRWSEKSKRIDKIVLDLERGGRTHGAWFRLLRHLFLLLLSLKSEVKVRYVVWVVSERSLHFWMKGDFGSFLWLTIAQTLGYRFGELVKTGLLAS